MPPKKIVTVPLSPSQALPSANMDLAQQIQELTRTINGLASRFDGMEELIGNLRTENRELKSTVADRDKELFSLKDRLNDLEQYGRNWSVRILNLPLQQDAASDPRKVMQQVFDRVLLPIFEGALQRGEIPAIPRVDDILETAHILPAQPNKVNTIIARFYTRNIRNLVFRLKKDFARREPADGRPTGGAALRAGRFLYPIYEDLTRATFHKMRELTASGLVESCWTVNGIIKFKTKNSTVIRKVKSVYDSLENIIR